MDPTPIPLELRFESTDPTSHTVSAREFADAVSGLQRAIYLLALDEEGVDVRTKERLDARTEAQYELQIQTLQPGSVIAPLVFGALTTLVPPSLPKVADQLIQSLDAVSRGDAAELARIMPDGSRRRKLVTEIRRIAPARGSGLTISVSRTGLDSAPVARLTGETERRAKDLLRSGDGRRVLQTVTGELVEIDFDERSLQLRYPPTSTLLKVQYEEGAEAALIESRREPIQVTGIVTLDANGHPTRVNRVETLEPVDLAPIQLSEVQIPGGPTLRFSNVILYPDLDDSYQLYVIDDELAEGLPIHVFAPTRDELLDELTSEIVALYTHYVACDPEELAPDGLELRSAFIHSVAPLGDLLSGRSAN